MFLNLPDILYCRHNYFASRFCKCQIFFVLSAQLPMFYVFALARYIVDTITYVLCFWTFQIFYTVGTITLFHASVIARYFVMSTQLLKFFLLPGYFVHSTFDSGISRRMSKLLRMIEEIFDISCGAFVKFLEKIFYINCGAFVEKIASCCKLQVGSDDSRYLWHRLWSIYWNLLKISLTSNVEHLWKLHWKVLPDWQFREDRLRSRRKASCFSLSAQIRTCIFSSKLAVRVLIDLLLHLLVDVVNPRHHGLHLLP